MLFVYSHAYSFLISTFVLFIYHISSHESGATGVIDSDTDSDDSDDDHIFAGMTKEAYREKKEADKVNAQMKDMGL